MTNFPTTYDSIISSASQTYGVPFMLIKAVIQQESGYQPSIVSYAGAIGLMQLMPATARGLGVTNPYDPEQNINGGTKYLAEQINTFNGSIPLGLAAYNAGAGAVKAAGGIPQNGQTPQYVRSIMAMYGGGSSDTGAVSTGTNSTINLSYDPNSAFNDITIPQTNYGIVAHSQRYGDILYGRRYRVIVSDASGNAKDVSNLRCTFNIPLVIMQQPMLAQIELYNLNPGTENWIIQNGTRVIVEAGYEGSQYGEIFDGDIIQPIRDKPDATTYRLTLTALDGDRFMNYSIVGMTLLKGQTARSNITNIASKASIPSQLGTISENIGTSALTRGKVVFGMTKDYLRQLAKSENATFYYSNGKVHIVKANDLPSDEIYDLSPSSGLINTPTQSGTGITFQCMLNPNIKVNSFVHIDNSLIREQTYQTGQVIRNLDQDGIYRVVSVTYDGDTRGDNWYCDCTAVSQAGIIPGNVSATTSNAF